MTGGAGVGFSQRIRLEWLDYTANLLLAGNRGEAIPAALRARLAERFSLGDGRVSGNCDKAVSILFRVWAAVPEERRALRDEGLDRLRRASAGERLLVHWCMCMAAYPFFGAVAEAAGRPLRLQGSVAAAQAQRRLRARLGERETVARAARRVLRSFVDWGALVDTGEKGLYRGAPRRAVENPALAVWVLKALLSAEDAAPRSPSRLLRAPRLFPFDIAPPAPAELEAGQAFEIVHDGPDRKVLLSLAAQPAAPCGSRRRCPETETGVAGR